MCATFTNGDVGKTVLNAAGEEVGVVASVEGDVAHVRPASAAVDSVKSSIGWEGVAAEPRPLEADAVREITADAVRLEGDLSSIDRADVESAVDANTGDDADGDRTAPAGGSAGIEETDVAEDLRDETDEETLEETDAIDEERTNASDASDREQAHDRGLEVDPTELARGGRETGASVEPTDDFESTDAAVDPDADLEPTDAAIDADDDFESTDAAVDRTDEPRRTDAAVDPGEQPRRSEPDPEPDADRDATGGGPTTEDADRTAFEDGPDEKRPDERDEDADADRRDG